MTELAIRDAMTNESRQNTIDTMQRREWLAWAGAAACGTAAGCGAAPPNKNSAGRTLEVFNWSDYIDAGVIADFEAEHGCKVIYDNYSSDAELETRLATGAGSTYDVVFPSDRAAAPLIAKGIFQALDHDRLPNYRHLDRAFLGQPFDPQNTYSVPYFWGTLAVGLRPDRLRDPGAGLAPLFDPANRGRITMLDDMENVVAAVLGHLGYPLNSVETPHLAAVEQLLLDQKPLVQAYTSDAYRERLITGQAWAALGWSGDLLQADGELERLGNATARVAVVIPPGGTMLWIDSLMIPKAARHVELAHAFINHLLDPQVAVRNALKVNYASPNAAARAQLPREMLADTRIYPPAEVLARCAMLQDRGPEIEEIERVWRVVRQ
jgi:spermidine/putrescine transport system substrate-binding protein